MSKIAAKSFFEVKLFLMSTLAVAILLVFWLMFEFKSPDNEIESLPRVSWESFIFSSRHPWPLLNLPFVFPNNVQSQNKQKEKVGGSPDLVVMGDVSFSRGREFESQHHKLDLYDIFLPLICY